jgi:hypothetical protein
MERAWPIAADSEKLLLRCRNDPAFGKRGGYPTIALIVGWTKLCTTDAFLTTMMTVTIIAKERSTEMTNFI